MCVSSGVTRSRVKDRMCVSSGDTRSRVIRNMAPVFYLRNAIQEIAVPKPNNSNPTPHIPNPTPKTIGHSSVGNFVAGISRVWDLDLEKSDAEL